MRHISKALMAATISVSSLAVHAQQVVKIGFSSPLSGGQSSYGVDNRDGLLLAVKELNAKGIKVGQQKLQFEVVANDDGADPRQGVSVAQMMVDSKINYVVGPYNSGVAIPASRVYNDAGTVLLTVASNPKVTEQKYARLFRVGASDSQLGAKMAVYAAKNMKVKNVAVIDDRTSYGQGLAAEFTGEAKRQGLAIMSDPLTYAAAFYDAGLLLANAMEKTDSLEPGKIAEYLAKNSYKGVVGEYSFNDKHDLKSSAVTVFTFKDGQPVPLLSL